MTATSPVVERTDSTTTVDAPRVPAEGRGPAARDGERTDDHPTRRRRSPDHNHWIAGTAIVALAVLVGAVAAMVGEPRPTTAASEDESAAADTQTAGTAEIVTPSPSPAQVGLFMHRGGFGVADVVALVGVSEGAESGSVVLIPPGTLVEVPALGLHPVSALPNLVDQQLLVTTLENAFGVRLDSVSALTDETLAAALAPAQSVEVDLHRPILVEDTRGVLRLPSGPQELTAAEAMRLLTADPGEDAFDRLVVGQAVIDGWRRSLTDDAAVEATVDVDPALSVLASSGEAEMHFVTLPVTRLGATPADELFGLDRDEVRATMGEAFPWALLASEGERPRVELLNGTGRPGLTDDVAAVVVPAGGEVTLTGNVPGFGVDSTQVVYYRDEDRDYAQRLLEALGVGSLAVADEPLGVIDLTVVIGADYPDAAPEPGDGTVEAETVTAQE